MNKLPCLNTATPPIASELSDEDLERFLLGRINDQTELKQIEAHLGRCAVCAERIQTMSGAIFALVKALQELELYALDNSAKLSALYRINRSWSPTSLSQLDDSCGTPRGFAH